MSICYKKYKILSFAKINKPNLEQVGCTIMLELQSKRVKDILHGFCLVILALSQPFRSVHNKCNPLNYYQLNLFKLVLMYTISSLNWF